MEQQENELRRSKKKAFKIVGIAIVIVAIVCSATGMWLYVESAKAVNDYVGDVDEQYQRVVAGEGLDDMNVTLKSVWLGEVVNAKYKQMKAVDDDYQTLINRLRNYTRTMNVHNEMVEKFNAGIEGDEILSGDILTLTTKMYELTSKYYSDQTAAIESLDALVQKISENTRFSDISGDVSAVLHANDTWLNSERDAIENAREAFQNEINNI